MSQFLPSIGSNASITIIKVLLCISNLLCDLNLYYPLVLRIEIMYKTNREEYVLSKRMDKEIEICCLVNICYF